MKKTILKTILFLLIVSIVLPNMRIAYADEGAAGVASGLAGLAGTIRRLGIIASMVALVFTGIQFMIGGSQEAQKAWPRVLLIIAALIAMIMLPAIIETGSHMSAKWDPPTPPHGVTWNGGWGSFETEGVDVTAGAGTSGGAEGSGGTEGSDGG